MARLTQWTMLGAGCGVPYAPHFHDRLRHVNHREVQAGSLVAQHEEACRTRYTWGVSDRRALKKEHQTALKEALFEERQKDKGKQHEVLGPLKEALEKAKKKPVEAQVEVSDLTVQVNQEKALRVELEGQLAQGQSLAETLKTQLDAQKEMTTQRRELYQPMAAKGSSTQPRSQSQ